MRSFTVTLRSKWTGETRAVKVRGYTAESVAGWSADEYQFSDVVSVTEIRPKF